MIQRKSISLADQVVEQLEKEILSGNFQRGQVLTENNLATQLGVSRTPVREALNKLIQNHMVEELPKGIVVVGISDEDVSVIYDIREKIEGMAGSLAASCISNEQLGKLKEILDLQEFYIMKNDAEKIREQDSEFHEMFYRSCGSTVLYDTLSNLHKKVSKYRSISVSSKTRAAESLEEHRAIYDALKKHDPKAAEEACVLHVNKARSNIEKNIKAGGK